MNKKEHIFLIEDEEDICDLIKLNLEYNGYSIEIAHEGHTAIKAIQKNIPDLIILDLMLPDINGMEVCTQLKSSAATQKIPIIMLTANSTEEDILQGFERGASDYITKPFSPKILLSRIKASLHKHQQQQEKETTQLMTFAPFALDLKRHVVRKGEKEIAITLCEFNILKRLLSSRGNILSRDQLLNELSAESEFIIDRNVDVHIYSIRKKLGPRFHWIETVRSLGYRFRQ